MFNHRFSNKAEKLGIIWINSGKKIMMLMPSFGKSIMNEEQKPTRLQLMATDLLALKSYYSFRDNKPNLLQNQQ